MMRVNFFGSLWCTRFALPHLKARRGRQGPARAVWIELIAPRLVVDRLALAALKKD